MPPHRPPDGPQFLRFCLVGTVNTGLGLAVYAAAVAAGVWYLAAAAGAFAVGTVSGYLLNSGWTFGAGPQTVGGFARYGLVQAGALGINIVALYALVHVLGVARIGGQALTVPMVSLVAFAGNRHWTFRSSRPERLTVRRTLSVQQSR